MDEVGRVMPRTEDATGSKPVEEKRQHVTPACAPSHAPAWALWRGVVLRVDLDDANEDNGPLRVIRGSHVLGVLTDQDVLNYGSAHQEVPCLARRGG